MYQENYFETDFDNIVYEQCSQLLDEENREDYMEEVTEEYAEIRTDHYNSLKVSFIESIKGKGKAL